MEPAIQKMHNTHSRIAESSDATVGAFVTCAYMLPRFYRYDGGGAFGGTIGFPGWAYSASEPVARGLMATPAEGQSRDSERDG